MLHSEIVSKLLPSCPYSNFDESGFVLDLQGWGSTEPIFEQAINAVQPSVVLEIGSWKGASAVHFASLIPSESVVICVDTWLGTINNFLGRDGLSGDSLKRENGYPRIYYQFLANVKLSGMQNKIIPLPQTSNNGFAILKMMDIHPEIVYIDGSHEFDDVLNDLRNAYSILSERGVIIGDDFSREGVREAVYAMAEESSAKVMTGGEKFVIFKNRVYEFPKFMPLPRRAVPFLKRVANALYSG